MKKSENTKSKGFQFKQFFVAHDKCAMKVNTDGILLGCLAPVQKAQHILDLGTGTGLIAIMAAQRRPQAQIIALELEQNAYQQATENAQDSPWVDRIQVLQGDILQVDFSQKFDLITANPPYFEHSLAGRNQARDLARATPTDGHLAWLIQAEKWLSENGIISFILPFEMGEKLIKQASTSGLFCQKICKIYTKPDTVPKRMVVYFGRSLPTGLKENELVIYDEQAQYTPEFVSLTKDFYLHF